MAYDRLKVSVLGEKGLFFNRKGEYREHGGHGEGTELHGGFLYFLCGSLGLLCVALSGSV